MKSRNTARVHRAQGAALRPLITLLFVVLLLPAARLRAETPEQELARLRKEVADLRADNEALRKAKSGQSHGQKVGNTEKPLQKNGGLVRHPYKPKLEVVQGSGAAGKGAAEGPSKNASAAAVEEIPASDEKSPNVSALKMDSNTGSSGGFHVKFLQRNDIPIPGVQGGTAAAKGEFAKSDLLEGASFGSSITNAFRLRKDFNDLKAFEVVQDPNTSETYAMSNDITQDLEPQPAAFNWSHDYLTKKETWNSQGVLYLPMTVLNDSGRPRSLIPSFPGAQSSWTIFYPAVRWDRDSSKDGSSTPVNSLDFLIGADFNFYHTTNADRDRPNEELPGVPSNFAYIIRMAAGMHTDFSFHRPKPLWEMSYDPLVNSNIGINSFNYSTNGLGGSFPLMWKLTARVLTQATAQPDSSADVKQGDSTFPVGFQTGLTITPRDSNQAWFGKAQLSATYTGQWDTQHNDQYDGLFEATLNVPIANSVAGWTLTYKNGNDPTSHDKVNELDLALSLKL